MLSPGDCIMTLKCRFMTCQFCGSSSHLIFIGTKSVSVYRHVAGVSAAAHNEVDPTRGVY